MADTNEAAGAKAFERDTCLYRAGAKDATEAEARVFRAGERVPPKSEGWVDHPSLARKG